MKAIIVGGGKVGYYLLKTLLERKHKVVLIERDKDVCSRIAEDIEAEIILGDGTDLDVLKDADINEAEVVAAVTGKDEENLVICQIAKASFDISKTIARVNNPKNRSLFKALGVDTTVCSTEVIANLIEWEFECDKLKIVQTIDKGELLLVEAIISPCSAWMGKKIKEIKMPEEVIIASIFRDDKIVYRKGDTVLLDNDRALLVTNIHRKVELERSIFKGGHYAKR